MYKYTRLPNIDTLNCSCMELTLLLTVSIYTTPSSIVELTRVRLSPCRPETLALVSFRISVRTPLNCRVQVTSGSG